MFKPIFQLTPQLLTNLTTIERLYGRLEALQIPKKLELNLERDNLVQSSYISNSIEGNPLSLPEVTNLLLGDRVPVNRDEKEVKNYFNLLRTLSDKASEPFIIDMVLQLHQELLTGVDSEIAGKIRNKRVVIGGYRNVAGQLKLKIKHEPPFHTKSLIKKHLSKLLAWVKTDAQTPPLLKAGIFHHQYVYLHPFADGNGRTCRLLTALTLLKYGYQINKYFVLDDYYDIDRSQYSDMLSSADSGDKTKWLIYFTNGVKYSLQSALSRVDHALKTITIEARPTKREQEVLALLQKYPQLTSSDLVEEFNISRQQAHKLLIGLVDKGYAIKKGGTKNSFYVQK